MATVSTDDPLVLTTQDYEKLHEKIWQHLEYLYTTKPDNSELDSITVTMGFASKHIEDILTALCSSQLPEMSPSDIEANRRLFATLDRCAKEAKERLVLVGKLVEKERMRDRLSRMGITIGRESRLQRLFAKTDEMKEGLRPAVDSIKNWEIGRRKCEIGNDGNENIEKA